MKLWQIYGATFFVHYVLALFLILLGAFIPFMRLRELWWGKMTINDLSFFLRPLLQLCLETFYYVATAMFCCSLTAKKNPAVPYIVYLIFIILIGKLANGIACYFAYKTVTPIDGQGFRAYYFYDIDQMGLENHFSPSIENPWERKIWGEIRLLGYAAFGMIYSVISWFSFHYQYKRK